jgi:KTSC domain
MQRHPVSSTNLASVGYDLLSQTLEVEFGSGGVYQYFDVPEHVHQELLAAGSAGSYFARSIKNSFACSKV